MKRPTAFEFEPHNGFGTNAPDGEPYPLGYISSTSPRIPLLELSPVLGEPSEAVALAERLVTAVNAETVSSPPSADVVKVLRGALKPFADYMAGGMDCDDKGAPLPDDQGAGWVYLTMLDFRRARAALSAFPETEQED